MKIFDVSKPESAFRYHDSDNLPECGARLKIIGVGGTGCHAVDHCIHRGLYGIAEYTAIDTDENTLAQNLAGTKISILPLEIAGPLSPKNNHAIRAATGEADMVFIVSGMGGTTDSAVSPRVAQLAMESEAFTVCVVLKPHASGGEKRQEDAEDAMKRLLPCADLLVILHGDNVRFTHQNGTAPPKSLSYGNELILQAIRCISDSIMVTGLIGLDFADICATFSRSNTALIGVGHGVGPLRAREAAIQALTSPLLNGRSSSEATGIFIQIAAAPDSLTIEEIGEAVGLIQEKAPEDALIFFGTVFYESLDDEMQITILVAMPSVDNTK